MRNKGIREQRIRVGFHGGWHIGECGSIKTRLAAAFFLINRQILHANRT